MNRVLVLVLAAIMLVGCSASAAGFTATSTPSFQAASSPDRTLVIISDLHVGPGKRNGSWYPTEDFRWPQALKSFLEEISDTGKEQVDLVIAGDFLEMWQPPADIGCPGSSANKNLGCTVEEMSKISSWVVKAHPQVFEALRDFTRKGENRVHVIPGNHDAALLIAEVWEPVGKALEAGSGRVNFVATGVWISPDGRIVIEHGHQIGNEANKYKTWPDIVRTVNGKDYIVRPWGEQFVQKVFNDEETEYSIIDNLAPESAGVRYRLDESTFGEQASDIANFVAFNLFQTSLAQKVQVLGPEEEKDQPPEWNITKARDLGHRLFVAALPKDDPVRAQILAETDRGKEIRGELDTLAREIPEENVKMLCDHAAIQGDAVCRQSELGSLIDKKLIPREWVLAAYLAPKQNEYPRMRYFIYGHTHEFETIWQPFGLSYAKVLNSGAFHRVIDEKAYLKLVKDHPEKISPAEGLRTITVDKLPACYTYIKYHKGLPEPQVWRWCMEESDDTGRAELVKD